MRKAPDSIATCEELGRHPYKKKPDILKVYDFHWTLQRTQVAGKAPSLEFQRDRRTRKVTAETFDPEPQDR